MKKYRKQKDLSFFQKEFILFIISISENVVVPQKESFIIKITSRKSQKIVIS